MYNSSKFGTKLLSSIINFFRFCLRTDVILGITSDNRVPGTTGTLCLSPSSIFCCPVLPPVSFLLSLVQDMWGFPWWLMVKNPPAMQEMRVQSLGGEDPLEKGMVTHSSIWPGESHGQRRLAGYSPWGRVKVGHDWATNTFTSLHMGLMTLGEPLASAISPVFSHLFKSQKNMVNRGN